MAYDHIVTQSYLDEITRDLEYTYTLTADAEYQEVEPLLQAIALQAVRALKAHYAIGPDAEDEQTLWLTAALSCASNLTLGAPGRLHRRGRLSLSP